MASRVLAGLSWLLVLAIALSLHGCGNNISAHHLEEIASRDTAQRTACMATRFGDGDQEGVVQSNGTVLCGRGYMYRGPDIECGWMHKFCAQGGDCHKEYGLVGKGKGLQSWPDGATPRKSFPPSNPHNALRDAPAGYSRASSLYGWCDQSSGTFEVRFWPHGDQSQGVVVKANSVLWAKWNSPVTQVDYLCDGMTSVGSITMKKATVWSLQVYTSGRHGWLPFYSAERTGRMKWNTWDGSHDLTSVPFTSHSDGYACMKAPALLKLDSGILIAFAEGRTPTCSDFAKTDIIFKRSDDGGKSWSAARKLVDPGPDAKTVCGMPLVIGSMVPVQLVQDSLYHPGRIIVPHTRNSFEVWQTHSDDDGVSWSDPKHIKNAVKGGDEPDCTRDMAYFGFANQNTLNFDSLGNVASFMKDLFWRRHESPYQSKDLTAKLTGDWQFVGLGAGGGGAQLLNGRIVLPAFHSYIRGLPGGFAGQGEFPVSQLYNKFGLAHFMISDDDGDIWELSSTDGVGVDKKHPITAGQGGNEGTFVQLKSGNILANFRSLATGSPQFRLQTISKDGGKSWAPTKFVYDLPEPFAGCQGSTAIDDDGVVYFSHPDPSDAASGLASLMWAFDGTVNMTGRDHMTIWWSKDNGATYPKKFLVDAGGAGYSSMQYSNNFLWLLYEQADPGATDESDFEEKASLGRSIVQVPSRIVLRKMNVDEMSKSLENPKKAWKPHDDAEYQERRLSATKQSRTADNFSQVQTALTNVDDRGRQLKKKDKKTQSLPRAIDIASLTCVQQAAPEKKFLMMRRIMGEGGSYIITFSVGAVVVGTLLSIVRGRRSARNLYVTVDDEDDELIEVRSDEEGLLL